MEKALRFLKKTITKEDFETMMKNGLRPGTLTPGQSVLLFLEIKKSLRDEGTVYEENLGEEDLLGIFENQKEVFIVSAAEEEDALIRRLSLIRNAMISNGLPVREETVGEVLRAMKMFDELEELGDGVCEYILRNGVEPTLWNLHSLRFTKESRKIPVVASTPGPWSFPENKGVDVGALIEQAGLERNDFTESQVKWMEEKGIYASPRNLRILNELWSVNLPVEEEDAVLYCMEAILRGEKAENFRLFEVGTLESRAAAAEKEGRNFESAEKEERNFESAEKEERNFESAEKEGVNFEGPEKEGKNLHTAGSTEFDGEGELRQLEEQYEKIYVDNHGKAAFIEALHGEYCECLSRDREIEILRLREIPVTADHIYALSFLCSPEGENFFQDLADTVGRRRLFSAYKKRERGDAEKCLTGEVVKILLDQESAKKENLKDEKTKKEEISKKEDPAKEGVTPESYEARLKHGIHLCKVLSFLGNLRAIGYEEVPVPVGKKCLRLRIRRNGKGEITARTDSDLTGTLILKFSEDAESARVLVVAEREDTLEELKNSRLIEERLKKAGWEGVFTTYLCKPDLADRDKGNPVF